MKTDPTIVKTVRQEALIAYADCVETARDGHTRESIEETMSRRNLNWKASHAIGTEEAVDIMKEVCPFGYNDFEAEVLGDLPDDCRVFLAREDSVCVYVLRGKNEFPGMMANEKDLIKEDKAHGKKGEYRFWWD